MQNQFSRVMRVVVLTVLTIGAGCGDEDSDGNASGHKCPSGDRPPDGLITLNGPTVKRRVNAWFEKIKTRELSFTARCPSDPLFPSASRAEVGFSVSVADELAVGVFDEDSISTASATFGFYDDKSKFHMWQGVLGYGGLYSKLEDFGMEITEASKGGAVDSGTDPFELTLHGTVHAVVTSEGTDKPITITVEF